MTHGTRPLTATVDKADVGAALSAIFADPGLCSEADKLFLGEDARYESGGLLSYFFVIPSCTADEAHGQHAAFRRRDDAERLSVLLTPENYGLVVRHDHSFLVRETDNYRRKITAEMIDAGSDVLTLDAADDLRDGIITPWALAERVFHAMLRVQDANQ